MDLAARQLLRALRGKRSQLALSRRLGYRGVPITNWETGRRFPTARETLRICSSVGVDVQAAFSRFMPSPASGCRVEHELDRWLTDLLGSSSIKSIAERSGYSRFTVSRWLTGSAQPRLPDFLCLVEAITGRASDLVAELVPIELVPALEPSYRARQAARGTALEEPWTEAVLRALESPLADQENYFAASLAERLPITSEVAERCLRALERAGLVTKDGKGYRSTGTLTVDTKASPELMRRLAAHWTQTALNHVAMGRSDDLFAYNVLGVSAGDLERIRNTLRASFREIRTLVAASPSGEAIALVNLQLVRLDRNR